jgi:hydrogenase maturation factor
MCLTIPKKVLEIRNDSVVAEDFQGNRQELKTLIELAIGDFVISQNNIVIEKIDEELAEEIIDIMKGERRI